MTDYEKFFEKKSALELYFLRKRLPEFTDTSKKERFLKNFNYYQNDNNDWNNKHCTSKKIYKLYHKYNDVRQDAIENIREQDLLDLISRERNKREYFSEEKRKSKFRLTSSKFKRTQLQYECGQMINNESDEDFVKDNFNGNEELIQSIRKRGSKLKITSEKSNLWNDITRSSEKTFKMICPANIIKKDDEAVELIKKKMEKDNEIENFRQEAFKMNREEIRNKFTAKHNKNLELEEKLYGKRFQICDYNTPTTNNNDLYNSTFKTKFSQTGLKFHTLSESLEKLSKPKNKHYEPKNLLLGHSEFKGLYSTEIDDKIATRTDLGFVKTILENSTVAKENVERLKKSRPGTSQDKTSSWFITHKDERKRKSSARKENEKKEEECESNFKLLEELNDFSKKNSGRKNVGYPNIALLLHDI